MTIKEKIDNILDDISQAEEYAKKKLRNAPSGSLRVKKTGSKTYYYHRKGAETTGDYLDKDHIELIRALEEKAYCQTLLETAEREKADLQKLQSIWEHLPDFNTAFLKIPQSRRHLIGPFEPSVRRVPDQTVKDWLSVIEPRKYVDPNDCYTTRNGEIVRSKSELIIADRLTEKGVPYYYERPFTMFDVEQGGYFAWYPDFLVLNRRTGRQYYWEHFGLLDDADYCAGCQFKLEEYAKNGLFQGKNLIVTAESSKHNLNTEYIDRLIKEYLL